MPSPPPWQMGHTRFISGIDVHFAFTQHHPFCEDQRYANIRTASKCKVRTQPRGCQIEYEMMIMTGGDDAGVGDWLTGVGCLARLVRFGFGCARSCCIGGW